MMAGGDPEARRADAIEAEAWRDLFEAMPPPMRAATGARTVDAGGATVLVAPGLPIALFNRAIGLGGERAATEGDVDEVLGVFAAASVATFLIHTSAAATRAADGGDVPAWLEARGLARFAARPTWAKFVRGPEPVAVTSELHVRPASDAQALAAVIARAHGMPPAMVGWIAALVGRPRWHLYEVVAADEALVGGGASYVAGDHAWLGLGGTLEAYRRRGGQRALLACRIAEAAALGATTIATETGESTADEPNPSLANIRWCGFRAVASRVNWTRRS